MAVTWVQKGCHIDYTPAAAVTAGDVVVLAGLVGVADNDIAADRLGALTIEGIYSFPKAAVAVAAGQNLYWDATNLQAVVTPSAGMPLLGPAPLAALSGDARVPVILNGTAGTVVKRLTETVLRSAMTDNTNATGFKDFAAQLPVGALVLGWKATTKTGFTGDTTAVMQVGDTSDLNRFSAVTTNSVLAAGLTGAGPANDANPFCAAATTVRVTITGGSDFTAIAAGEVDIEIMYVI